MRLFRQTLVAVSAFAASALAAAPPGPTAELATALAHFRSDVPPGWTYQQTTKADGQSTVERYDATRATFDRWSLLQKDGRSPTQAESQDYISARSRRSRGGTAPRLAEQIDSSTAQQVEQNAERTTFVSRLKPAETGNTTSAFLLATIVVHRATATIERFELRNTAPFAPTLGVKISAFQTTLTFSIPEGDTPSLPLSVETRVRGTAFWFKSLDAEMSIRFSDYRRAKKER